MMTISKPLSAGQAESYHRSEFTSPDQNYYTSEGRIRGEWQGRLAADWGLTGEVTQDQFSRLAGGLHPQTGEPLVRQREAFRYKNAEGETVRTMEHRAGWDATFSAPKSVSLTALVGGDERVREAHRESVRVAVDELERHVQARTGGNHPPESTGKWAAAKFEHDSARPVDGYSAPQLHTHVVFFNVTATADGKTRAMQPQELYRSQQFATAVYQSELAWRLKQLGYDVDPGRNGAPEIRGYTREYLEASSPRSRQIRQHLEARGLHGAGPAQIAAHRTRDAKVSLGPGQMLARHRQVAAEHGNQPDRVVEEARRRGSHERSFDRARQAHAAVTWARDRNMEREAVVDERDLVRDALRRSMGQATLGEVRADLEIRIRSGEFVVVAEDRPGQTGRSLTTRETLDCERDTVARALAEQGRFTPIATALDLEGLGLNTRHLNDTQRRAVEELLAGRDRVMGLQGTAGAGKTTSLAVMREVAERSGYRVEGLAPTSRAAAALEEAGIRSRTLQSHLARGEAVSGAQPRLYFVDESSLASTRQVNGFLRRLGARDRVVFVGDTRQHQGVEAGKPFEQLQRAGMRTARLDQIVRQKDPGLKTVVEQLSRGEVGEAVESLIEQGRVHGMADAGQRMKVIAASYADQPENALVVAPDNDSRVELNRLIHHELRERGLVSEREHAHRVLAPRQDLTGADRQWASKYEAGDVIRFTKGSRVMGVSAGEYVRVKEIDPEKNLLTVIRRGGGELTYDPLRLQGVSVYREVERRFSAGDRIQFTAPWKERRISNRQFGTVEGVEGQGELKVRLDSGRTVEFNPRDNPHIDHGYAVTSHSAQGATADRVLVHIDTAGTHRDLINSRLAYVAVSRGRYDAQVYTNDVESLARALGHEVSKSSAMADDHQRTRSADEVPCNSCDGPADGTSSIQPRAPEPSRAFELDR